MCAGSVVPVSGSMPDLLREPEHDLRRVHLARVDRERAQRARRRGGSR